MDVTIRRATIKDAKALSVIAKQTFYDTFTGTCSEKDMKHFLEDFLNEEILAKELNDEKDYCFFACCGKTFIGYIRFKEDDSFAEMNQWKAIELKRLYVLKEYHGKGVAQQLMNFFMQYAIVNKYEAIWLGVWENNTRAQKFYEKYGFENSGHTHDFPIGSTPQTDYWFRKFL